MAKTAPSFHFGDFANIKPPEPGGSLGCVEFAATDPWSCSFEPELVSFWEHQTRLLLSWMPTFSHHGRGWGLHSCHIGWSLQQWGLELDVSVKGEFWALTAHDCLICQSSETRPEGGEYSTWGEAPSPPPGGGQWGWPWPCGAQLPLGFPGIPACMWFLNQSCKNVFFIECYSSHKTFKLFKYFPLYSRHLRLLGINK